MTVVPQVVFEARLQLGEGPLWDWRDRRLLWLDVWEGAVHALDPASGEHEVATLRVPVGHVALAQGGGYLAGTSRGVLRIDLRQRYEPISEALDPHLFMNDGAVGPDRRLYTGSLALDKTPCAGAVYRLSEDGSVFETLFDQVSISNGFGWSPDGRTMFHVDSGTSTISARPFARSGALGPPRIVRAFDAGSEGSPDGLAVDHDGNLWVAFWGGGAVRCISPEGEVLDEIRVPAPLVTSCAFGGPELRDLYITTCCWDYSEGELRAHPAAGSLFVARPGPAGVPEFECALPGDPS